MAAPGMMHEDDRWVPDTESLLPRAGKRVRVQVVYDDGMRCITTGFVDDAGRWDMANEFDHDGPLEEGAVIAWMQSGGGK